MRRRKWTEDEEIFLCENVGKLTFKKIGIELGRSESSIARKAKILGVKVVDNQGFLDGETFCETIGISRSTFEYWRSMARRCSYKKQKRLISRQAISPSRSKCKLIITYF